ncbi:MAG: response regulator [Burkholderiaceae bacterium]|nr:response regulator [Roseateles sp.]MBV8470175.1 response regulator [Burkholderiaceae bacterium]
MALILVVDDSSTMREIVSNYLVQNGFEVTLAVDGLDGLRQLRQDADIRLVVSDVNMPNMDGLTMAAKIRAEFSERPLHIVMLTTEDNALLRERGKQAGVTGWIVKPFRGEAVLSPFRKLCGLS